MLRLALVGATGVVGRECLALLDRGAGPAVKQIVAAASAASAGRDLGRELELGILVTPVVALDEVDFSSVDVAIFCAGAEVSRRDGERAAAAGALVVDNSSAFRMRADVPLVVPQVNPQALARRPDAGLVANPNCSTIQLVRALHPLHLLAGLDQVVVSTYQAASGGGAAGLGELVDTSASALSRSRDRSGAPSVTAVAAGRFGAPLAFNLVPHIGPLDDGGFAHEERKLAREPRKILGLPQLRVTATAVRAPVFHCHSEAAYVRLGRPVRAAEVEDALAAAPGLRVYRRDDPRPYPMPRDVGAVDAERELVHVGRVRVDPEDPHAVWLWIVADNLWVGAALNALQIADVAVRSGWLG